MRSEPPNGRGWIAMRIGRPSQFRLTSPAFSSPRAQWKATARRSELLDRVRPFAEAQPQTSPAIT